MDACMGETVVSRLGSVITHGLALVASKAWLSTACLILLSPAPVAVSHAGQSGRRMHACVGETIASRPRSVGRKMSRPSSKNRTYASKNKHARVVFWLRPEARRKRIDAWACANVCIVLVRL